MKKPAQRNYTLLEVALVVILVAILGFTGYYFYHAQKNANKTLETATKTAASPLPVTQKSVPVNRHPAATATIAMADNKISFNIGPWTAVTANASPGNRCRTVATATLKPACVDNMLLIPAGDVYSNPDQFNASISVYKHGTASDPSAWLQAVEGGAVGTATPLTINGSKAVKVVSVNPGGSKETDVTYAILGQDYDVLVYVSAFVGSHNSYKNPTNIDYQTYLPALDTLVKTITIK